MHRSHISDAGNDGGLGHERGDGRGQAGAHAWARRAAARGGAVRARQRRRRARHQGLLRALCATVRAAGTVHVSDAGTMGDWGRMWGRKWTSWIRYTADVIQILTQMLSST